MEKCSICDKELSHEDSILRSPYDGIVVCKEHRSFAFFFIPEIAKMELGLITDYPAHLKKCSFCDTDLTEGEIKSFSIHTFHTVCSKHKVAENMFNKDLAKDWFEFAEAQPQPCEYNEENQAKFKEQYPKPFLFFPYTHMKKLSDLKNGDEITDKNWDLLDEEVRLLSIKEEIVENWRISERTLPISDAAVSFNNGTPTLNIKVHNSEETMQHYQKEKQKTN